jgi:hypothetical protein
MKCRRRRPCLARLLFGRGLGKDYAPKLFASKAGGCPTPLQQSPRCSFASSISCASETRSTQARSRSRTTSEITGTKNADIEDLFDVDDYLSLFNAATGKKLKVTDLPPGDRIVRRIAEKAGEFEHGEPADHLLRHRDEMLSQLSTGTLDRFEKLIERINKKMPTT